MIKNIKPTIDYSNLLNKYRRSDKDTASSEVLIIQLSEKIDNYKRHMSTAPHDYVTLRALIMALNTRRKIMIYFSKSNEGLLNTLKEDLYI